jgi:hypothetical protein
MAWKLFGGAMKKRVTVAIAAALLIASSFATAFALVTERPVNPSVTLALPFSAPVDAGPTLAASEYAMANLQIGIEVGTYGIFEGYGGAIRVRLDNSRGDSRLCVIAERVSWLAGTVEKGLNVPIEAGTVGDLGVVWLDGPDYYGDCAYRIALQILVKQGSVWRALGTPGDPWTEFQEDTLPVQAIEDAAKYTSADNPLEYYNKANALVEKRSPDVRGALSEATQSMPGELTYEKVCAVFDWVAGEVEYVAEPEGEDRWQSPRETLEARAGDCEDFALLISDMVMEMGGTPRLYLIDEHAFAAVWVGEDSAEAESAVRGYYGADLKLCFVAGDDGFWIVADPLGSQHLGGLPVNAAPVSPNDWDFNETRVLYWIDMTRDPIGYDPFWDDRVWIAVEVGCSVVFAISVAIWAMESHVIRCARCGRRFSGEVVRCNSCGEPHHPHCLGDWPCAACGASIKPELPDEPPLGR